MKWRTLDAIFSDKRLRRRAARDDSPLVGGRAPQSPRVKEGIFLKRVNSGSGWPMAAGRPITEPVKTKSHRCSWDMTCALLDRASRVRSFAARRGSLAAPGVARSLTLLARSLMNARLPYSSLAVPSGRRQTTRARCHRPEGATGAEACRQGWRTLVCVTSPRERADPMQRDRGCGTDGGTVPLTRRGNWC